MKNANQIFAGFTMDYTAQVHFAKNDGGVWFTRTQDRSPYGYRWTAWRRYCEPDFSRFRATEKKARLSKISAEHAAKGALSAPHRGFWHQESKHF